MPDYEPDEPSSPDSDEEEDEEDEEGDPEDGGGEESGEPDGDEPEESEVVAPTGQALIELLTKDSEAQAIVQRGLADLARQRARDEEAEKAAREYRELIEKEDYAEIGRRQIEAQRKQEARSTVADEVLQEQFAPVFARVFAQPEFKTLTAEEREALHPDKYDSDAEYLTALTSFVEQKRYNQRFEAEVAKRIKERDEAAANEETSRKARRPLGATPAAIAGDIGGKRSSSDLIRSGFRRIIDPEAEDED